MALLVDTVESDEFGSSMGWVNLGFCSGTVVGPMGGGLIYSVGGFHAVMGSAVGLLGIDVILRLLIVERGEMEGIIIRRQSDTEGEGDAREDSNLLQRNEEDGYGSNRNGGCGYEQQQEQEQKDDNNRSDRTNDSPDSQQQQLAPEAAY
ncbi:hypothetical protein BDV19DRAFT_394706 [Aspergillus venezuelensis]